MTINEFLLENALVLSNGASIELRDILDDNEVYYGSYNQIMRELSGSELRPVANARLLSRDVAGGNKALVLYYIKDITLYPPAVLAQAADRIAEMLHKTGD